MSFHSWTDIILAYEDRLVRFTRSIWRYIDNAMMDDLDDQDGEQ